MVWIGKCITVRSGCRSVAKVTAPVVVVGLLVILIAWYQERMRPLPAERNEVEGLVGFAVEGAAYIGGQKSYFIGSRPPHTVPTEIIAAFAMPTRGLVDFRKRVDLRCYGESTDSLALHALFSLAERRDVPAWFRPAPTPDAEWFEITSSYIVRGPDALHRRVVGFVDKDDDVAHIYLWCRVDP